MGHHVGSKKGKQKKQNSPISPLSAILCNDIIACFKFCACLGILVWQYKTCCFGYKSRPYVVIYGENIVQDYCSYINTNYLGLTRKLDCL